MSAGLAASTVTPGSTAPDVSLTVPATALVCANAATGSSIRSAAPNMVRATVRMPLILPKLHNNRMKSAERNEVRGHCAAVVPREDADSQGSAPAVRIDSKTSYLGVQES